MSERIIGLIALLPFMLAIYVLIQIFGMEMATLIITATLLSILIPIAIISIVFTTIYGICKIITG
jgi:hypothetical protein